MTIEFEPFGKLAVYALQSVGGTDPINFEDEGRKVDPLYMYLGTDADSERTYLDVSGDYCCEIIGQGIYEEKLNMYEAGTYWGELLTIRFNMWATHPELGEISLQLDESRRGSRGSIRSVTAETRFPLWHRSRIFMTATASKMPGVILQSRGAPPFLHSDKLANWPAKNGLFRFDARTPLERRDRPGEVVATINAGALFLNQVT